ncbi:MAG: glucosaminidase domain-containing protein [Lachnospiraceae bacterium]|nr:glucosaminidase domain-containing protein [Lachnospiraceae bacterium]
MSYTNSSMVSYTGLSPNHSGQRTHSIDRITPHCVVGQLSARTICDCFPAGVDASCNYGIGTSGEVSLCVEEKNRSWCSSSSSNDQRAITIECACDKTEPYTMNGAVYATLIKLCTDICKRNGKSKLLWFGDKDKTLNYEPAANEMVITVHRWFANKSCPGNWLYARLGDLAAQVTAALGGASSTPTTTNLYRVRTSWDNAASQIGAYADLSKAKNACSNGYTVYDWNGKAVYTNSGTPTSGNSESDFVAKVGKLATADMGKFGILASVTTAQAILESGYGTTDLATNANNIFGMKCSLSGNTWDGSTWDGVSKYTKDTKEQNTDGSEYTVRADFRKYAKIEDSLGDHSAYLNGAKNGSSLRYAGLKGCTDYKKAIQIIKDGGYATDVSYVSKICNIIERWNLTQYDTNSGYIEPVTSQVWYRVRKSWADSASQKGAFHDLEYAKTCADQNAGYSVYDEVGNALYTNKTLSPYLVRVKIPDLYIRTEPTIDSEKVKFTGVGSFTIVKEDTGKCSTDGTIGKWGLLKSYSKDEDGWICLAYDEYTERA